MKKVILIGDSIRMAYAPVVEQELRDAAEVWGPNENCEDSRKTLTNLDAWVIDRKPDLVHINCGLHDIKRPFDSQGNQVPIADYGDNVRAILTQLKKNTDARIIWALTTPVNHQWHHENKPFDRFEEDVALYNAMSRKIAHDLEIPVSDLHGVIAGAGRDALLVKDGVHFKPEGSELLGKAVVKCIKETLDA